MSLYISCMMTIGVLRMQTALLALGSHCLFVSAGPAPGILCNSIEAQLIWGHDKGTDQSQKIYGWTF